MTRALRWAAIASGLGACFALGYLVTAWYIDGGGD